MAIIGFILLLILGIYLAFQGASIVVAGWVFRVFNRQSPFPYVVYAIGGAVFGLGSAAITYAALNAPFTLNIIGG